MKKVLFLAAIALALVGCQPQQGTSPSDSGVQSGSSASTNQIPSDSGSNTNGTNQSSRPQQSQPSQTQPNQE
jgi:hypothetical protein